MQNNPAHFTLTPQMIKEGLRQEDFEAYAQIPVRVLEPNDLPHTQKIYRGFHLSQNEMTERQEALVRECVSFCDYVSAEDHKGMKEGLVDFSSSVFFDPCYVHVSLPSKNFLWVLQNDKVSQRDPATCVIVEKDRERTVVTPYLPSLFGDQYHGLLACPQKSVVVKQYGNDGRLNIAHLTGLPVDRIHKSFARAKNMILDDLHEMRHLRQAEIRIPDGPYKEGMMFFASGAAETDSDLFACSSVLRVEKSDEKIKPYLATRYINHIISDPQYWIAPVLETALAGKPAPDLMACHHSTLTIHKILAEQLKTGDLHDFVKEDPVEVYSLLRGLQERGIFRRDKLTDHLAKNIVDSVEYFCPGLSKQRTKTLFSSCVIGPMP